MAAVLNYEGTPEYTLAAVLTDKEEIGSVGATGMGAMYFENTMAELIACVTGEDKPLTLRRCLQNSRMLTWRKCRQSFRRRRSPLFRVRLSATLRRYR